MKRINVYLDEELWFAFRKQCLEQRTSASKEVARFIQQSLAEYPSTSTPLPVGSAQKELACGPTLP